MLDTAAKRINDAYKKYNSIYEVSAFYGSRENKSYYIEFYDNTIEFINENLDEDEEFEYVLWGVTQTAELVYHYLREHYEHAHLAAVIDKNKRLNFCGVDTCTRECVYKNSNKFYFVCTGAAIRESYVTFKEAGITKFYQCCTDGQKHKYEDIEN